MLCNARQQNPREQGFSLLETIIALVILGLAMAALFDAYGSGLRAIQIGNHHAQARLIAQSLLAEAADPAKSESRSGRRSGFSWQLVVRPATGDLASQQKDERWRLFEVAATVRWGTGRRIILRSLRIGPAK